MSLPFGTWLRRQHRRHDPVGDLARDFRADFACKGMHGYKRLREHITQCGAQCGALDALEQAVKEGRTEIIRPELAL